MLYRLYLIFLQSYQYLYFAELDCFIKINLYLWAYPRVLTQLDLNHTFTV
jgi:hypothetical protein